MDEPNEIKGESGWGGRIRTRDAHPHERPENIGIPGHPQASLIPFKKGNSPVPRRDRSASLGPIEPGDESHTRHILYVQLGDMLDALGLDGVQSVVNHARGWYAGLLPNKDRRTA
jgi:hypothetical protein